MSTVKYEIRDRVGYVTLNRADKLNAIDVEMRNEIWRVMHDVNDNPDVWMAVITGKGRAFSVGHDLVSMSGRGDDLYEDEISTEDLYVYQTQIYKPIIASINGFCLAQGGGIALASDIRIASDQAQFGWPQAQTRHRLGQRAVHVGAPRTAQLRVRVPVHRQHDLSRPRSGARPGQQGRAPRTSSKRPHRST